MTVKEMIARLQKCDPEAEVYFGYQQHYPMEDYTSDRRFIARRSDLYPPGHEDTPGSYYSEDGHRKPNDVILVSAGQAGYGSRKCWSDE